MLLWENLCCSQLVACVESQYDNNKDSIRLHSTDNSVTVDAIVKAPEALFTRAQELCLEGCYQRITYTREPGEGDSFLFNSSKKEDPHVNERDIFDFLTLKLHYNEDIAEEYDFREVVKMLLMHEVKIKENGRLECDCIRFKTSGFLCSHVVAAQSLMAPNSIPKLQERLRNANRTHRRAGSNTSALAPRKRQKFSEDELLLLSENRVVIVIAYSRGRISVALASDPNNTFQISTQQGEEGRLRWQNRHLAEL
jgi:hypothetical protein